MCGGREGWRMAASALLDHYTGDVFHQIQTENT